MRIQGAFLVIVLLCLSLTVPAFAGAHKLLPASAAPTPTPSPNPTPTPTPPPQPGQVVVVGSYYGYWGLNEVFINFLKHYFSGAQMHQIDSEIQRMTGIAGLPVNYSDYPPLDVNPGKHYPSLLANKAFYIDVADAQVVQVGASTTFSPKYSFRLSSFIGQTIDINGRPMRVLGAQNWSPIVLDLKGDGLIDATRHEWHAHAPTFYGERTAWFDMSGEGMPQYVEWLGTRDGLLVMPDADGSVKSALNLFGTAGGYHDGYEKMAEVLDKDHNGWIEGAELDGLYVWRDLNGNGQVDPGEMVPVRELGIEKISVRHQDYCSVYVRNGKTYKTWDWWPSGYELVPVAQE